MELQHCTKRVMPGDSIEVVRYLVNEMNKHLPLKNVIDDRDKDGHAPIHNAALCGNLEAIKFFITELDCDPNTPTTRRWGRGSTPLHCAAQAGQLHIVTYLIEQQKCNPSHMAKDKVTPLHLATHEGHRPGHSEVSHPGAGLRATVQEQRQ